MKRLLFTLIAVVALTACTKNSGGDEEITLTGGTSTTQTIYADETIKSDGIKFNASSSWTATVNNVTTNKAGGSQVDWLELSAYSGGAGEHTLMIIIKENRTGADRKAEIKINCGGTTITIMVEQKATNDPNPPKPQYNRYVKKTTVSDTYSKHEITYLYDDQKRVSQLVVRRENSDPNYPYENGIYNASAKFVYDGNNIAITVVDDDNINSEFEESINLKLNSKGLVIEEVSTEQSISSDSSEAVDPRSTSNYISQVASSNYIATKSRTTTHNTIRTNIYTYDDYNYMRKIEEKAKCIDHAAGTACSISTYNTTYNWGQNGNVNQTVQQISSANSSYDYQTTYKITYSPYPNKSDCNLDLANLIASDIFLGTIAEVLGLTGKRCQNFISSAVQKSTYSAGRYNYAYQFDKDGYVTKCTVIRSGGDGVDKTEIISIEYNE